MDYSAPGAFATQRCACCPTNWKHVDLGPAQKAAGDGSHAPTRGLRDRLAVISRQLALSSVPRPLSSASPALAAAGDGGVLINTVCGEISTTQLGWTVSPTPAALLLRTERVERRAGVRWSRPPSPPP
eukprot:COSAG04_NODE_12872_length_631_cov_0.697368_1_plen_127_part_10